MRVLPILILMIFFTTSCRSVLTTAYGIKKPKLETLASVEKYLKEKKIDSQNNVVFKSFNAFAMAQQRNILSIPDAMFFNAKGRLVRYKKETEDCNAKVDSFVSDLSAFSELPEDASFTLENLSAMTNRPVLNRDAGIIVVITWTVYAGRLNKTKAFEWIKLVNQAKAKGIAVDVYLLNCDFQQSWDLPPSALEKLGITN